MKLAILDDYQKAALASADWSSLGPEIDISVFDSHLGHDEDAVAEALAPFEILVVMRERTPFPRSLIERLPRLKLLVTTGMRNLAIDMAAARERGIPVCGTGMLPYPAAEHAMALILDLFKKISRETRAMHEGGWQDQISEGLNGKTLGILGLGKLGERVARFGQALEMTVVAWSRNLTETRCREVGVRLVDKETLLREADVLSIHLVLSDRTRGLIGPGELALMKPTAYLVNTSRGPIVDEAALIDALRSGTIAGAGLDVYDVEPLPGDHPLRALDNAVLTGHTGYVIRELYELVYGEALEAVAAWRAGAPVRVLNAEA
ncbi:MAG: D-2-hydroxyacid dehydrogenase family protein [Hyphomicrobiales bacterium]|nr:D-2-hydroxyacid dehydrogenase family protein [Hyphomicrobiales bacterium]